MPCTWHKLGCTEVMPYAQRREHGAVCAYRPLMCPEGCSCSFEDAETLANHLATEHDYSIIDGCDINFKLSIANARRESGGGLLWQSLVRCGELKN